MGVDLATIGLGVDTRDLERGEAALDQFADEGERTESRIKKAARSMEGELKRPGRSAKTMAPEMREAAKSASRFQDALKGNGVRNFAMQMNQVTQQAAAGGGFFRALTIQLPDMLLGFGTLGIAAGIAAPALMTLAGSLLSTGDSAKELEDRLEDLTKAVDRYRNISKSMAATNRELEDDFGSQSEAVKRALGFVQELERANAVRELENNIKGVTEAFGGLSRTQMVAMDTSRGFWASLTDNDPIALVKEIDNTFMTIRKELELTDEQAAKLTLGFEALANAQGLEAQIQAGSDLNEIFVQIYGSAEAIPESLRGLASATAEAAVQAARIVGAEEMAEIVRQRNLAKAHELIGAVLQEAEIRAAIARHGENSLQVEALRAEQQRELLAQKLDELGVTEEVKAELLASVQAAWDVAAGAEAAAGAISAAANEANRMASEIQRAVNGMIALSAQGISSLRESEIRLRHKGDPVATAGALAGERFGDVSGFDPILRDQLQAQKDAFIANAEATEANRQALIAWQKEQAKAAGGGGGRKGKKGGGGASSLNEHLREAEALFRATRTPAEQYKMELEKINELYRLGYIDADTYARATDKLADKFDKTRDVALEMEGALENMFVSILNGSESASDAVANLARQLGNMALQAAFSGLFGGLFKGIANIFTSAKGNVFDGGNAVAFANGGVVTRPTYFPMKNGQTGLMGEAGPEGVLPLKRGPNGKLGVRAEMPQAVHAPQVIGGDTISVSYNPVIDASGADPEAIRRLDENQRRIAAEFDDRVVRAVQKGKNRRLL